MGRTGETTYTPLQAQVNQNLLACNRGSRSFDQIVNELMVYLEAGTYDVSLQKDACTFGLPTWWNESENRFHVHSAMACDILTTASKQAFNACGSVINDRRTRLVEETRRLAFA